MLCRKPSYVLYLFITIETVLLIISSVFYYDKTDVTYLCKNNCSVRDFYLPFYFAHQIQTYCLFQNNYESLRFEYVVWSKRSVR